jgi:hypothetical protein
MRGPLGKLVTGLSKIKGFRLKILEQDGGTFVVHDHLSFPVKLYHILSNPIYSHFVSWQLAAPWKIMENIGPEQISERSNTILFQACQACILH